MEMLMAYRTHPVSTLFGLVSLLAAPVAVPSLATHALAATALTIADTDKDGTLDLAEVQAAAGAEFDKLDKDKDGTLDAKEAAGHVSKSNFKAADSDNDETLSKDEYTGLAAKLFKAANPDNDTTIDAKELASTPGRQLERLIK
jgi:Ca2+-binding EF-hand superfamily protein